MVKVKHLEPSPSRGRHVIFYPTPKVGNDVRFTRHKFPLRISSEGVITCYDNRK
jgi:hypothetical protein